MLQKTRAKKEKAMIVKIVARNCNYFLFGKLIIRSIILKFARHVSNSI